MSGTPEHVEQLKNGQTVKIRFLGGSMWPRVKSGQMCTIEPTAGVNIFNDGEMVFCTVMGKRVIAVIRNVGRLLKICDNRGRFLGWTPETLIHGRCVRVD
jgi:hypothetical protein